jgi:hypothetical protein
MDGNEFSRNVSCRLTFRRNFNGQLMFEMSEVPAESYRAICDAVAGAFDLSGHNEQFDNILGFVSRYYRRGEQVAAFERDEWTDLMVIAQSPASEPLVEEIAAWLLQNAWATTPTVTECKRRPVEPGDLGPWFLDTVSFSQMSAEHKQDTLSYESRFILEVTETDIANHRPEGKIERVALADLRVVVLETHDPRPFVPAVWWVLVGNGPESGCVYPGGAQGAQDALKALHKLPGFDSGQVIRGMGFSGNARFLCWQAAPKS